MSASICLDGTDWKLLPLMPREWEWRRIWEKPEEKLTPLWIAARVPGTVQDDAFDAGLIPNYTRDFNSRACEWTSERDWVYLKKFTKPDLPTDGIARLRFEGVDYACHVFLNSQPLGAHEGMYEVFEFDITDQLVSTGPNILVVVVEHAPREVGQIGRTSEVRLWKARFAYDWDWCTRLVPLGIWDSVNLLVSGSAYIRDVQIATALEDDFSAAEVGIEVEVSTSRTQRVTLQGAISLRGTQVAVFQGSLLAKGASTRHSAAIHLKSPALWWPNGYGEQPLYEATVSLYDREGNCLDTRAVGFGLRHIRAIPNEGAPPEALPYCLEINGKRVFIKGWNWAPIQQLYGRPGPEMYARWLGLAARANCNLLRVWGGGLLEKECFYHLCDQLGIMVWQEFIQSSSGLDNRPSTDPEYLRYIRRQATKMVRRRRNHPSLVIWTGGNELMDDNWTPLDDSHPALAVLKKVVQRLDPDRIWYPTSAAGPVANARVEYVGQMQDVHGPWQYQGPVEQYTLYNRIDPLLHSEFGVEGAANIHSIRRFASEEHLWPPDEMNPLWLHHGAWWVQRPMMERVFGPLDDLRTYVMASQFLQAEGLRYACESHRRRKWHCGGTMPWQFNESWPNLSCTNSVDFYGHPRPAYWWVKLAYEPFHVSAKYDKLCWRPGEEFTAEGWINNSLAAEPAVEVSWDITDLRGNELASGQSTIDVPEGAAIQAGSIRWTVSEAEGGIFVLRLHATTPSGARSTNWYIFGCAGQPVYAPLLKAPRASLAVTHNGDTITVENRGDVWALFVRLEPADGESWFEFNQNYVLLARGEKLDVLVAPASSPVVVSGWNFEEQTL